MRLALALTLLPFVGSPAIAQPLPIPQSRTGSCPWGYIWSAGQCIPSGGRAAPLAMTQGLKLSAWLDPVGRSVHSRS